MEAGYNYTRGWSSNYADAYNDDADGNHTGELYPYYADFRGLTQNHAIYLTYGNRFWNKLSIQVGLRGEYYMRHLDSEYKDGTGAVKDSYAPFPGKKDTAYFQLFPSAYISYDFGHGHELQLNYTRRVNRPRGHQLNPRMDMSDSTNISYGNVDLLPAYSNNLELNYLKTWERHTLSAGVFWKYREFYWNNVGAVHETMYHLGDTIPVNLSGQNIFAGSVRINAQFLFTKNFSGQLTGMYRSPRVVAQGTTSHSYSIDVGLRYTLLNKQLALALNVRDLLDSRARRNTTWGEGFWQFSENRWHSRSISFTVTYNFGNQSGKRRGRPEGDLGGNDDFDDSGNSNMEE